MSAAAAVRVGVSSVQPASQRDYTEAEISSFRHVLETIRQIALHIDQIEWARRINAAALDLPAHQFVLSETAKIPHELDSLVVKQIECDRLFLRDVEYVDSKDKNTLPFDEYRFCLIGNTLEGELMYQRYTVNERKTFWLLNRDHRLVKVTILAPNEGREPIERSLSARGLKIELIRSLMRGWTAPSVSRDLNHSLLLLNSCPSCHNRYVPIPRLESASSTPSSASPLGKAAAAAANERDADCKMPELLPLPPFATTRLEAVTPTPPDSESGEETSSEWVLVTPAVLAEAASVASPPPAAKPAEPAKAPAAVPAPAKPAAADAPKLPQVSKAKEVVRGVWRHSAGKGPKSSAQQ